MELLKQFVKSKEFKRAMWTCLNVIMGLSVSLLSLLATDDIRFAIVLLPVVTALSQMLTKYLNR